MNFDLDDEQTMLKDLVDRFVADRYDPAKRLAYVARPEGFARENWAMLAQTGLLALPLAEDAGGMGGGAVELITLAESLGRGVAVEPYLAVILMGAALIDRGGDDALRAQWLPAIAAGERFCALAHMERAGRYLPGALDTRATGGRLWGEKIAVLGAPFADMLLVSARDEKGHLAVYFVVADAPGIHRDDYRLVDGSVASDLRFADTPAIRLPDGAAALDIVLDLARLAITAELVGLMAHMFEATVDYVKTRQQFGQPIGRFQAIQHRLADDYAMVELSRSQLYRAAAQPAGGAGAHAAIVGAKAYVSTAASHIAEDAVQLHGGIGTTEELMVGQAFKRVLLLTRLLGDADHDLRTYARLCRAA
ncbi:acyl-CoA dehydrogenase family protein [Sphingobium amiense]|nr:acyl-CoA dehydrogenase family protein [Sphingobium amiense]